MRQHLAYPLVKYIRTRRVQPDKGRPHVAAQVVHALHRSAQRERERLGRGETDGQTARQPRALRDRHLGHVGKVPRHFPRAPEQRLDRAQVLARRQIRHHAAVLFVNRDLAVHPLRHQPARRIEERDRAFIT